MANKQLHFGCSDEVRALIEEAAARESRTVANYVRERIVAAWAEKQRRRTEKSAGKD